MKAPLLIAVLTALVLAATGIASDYTPDQVKAMAGTISSEPPPPIVTRKVTPAEAGAPPAAACPGCAEECWGAEMPDGNFGTWPFSQKITETRYWCASWRGGPQYYRTSHVVLGSPRCSYGGAYGRLVSGGNGYTWATVRSGGSFDCYGWNFQDWTEFACNTWGNCAWQRRGRL